MHQIHQQSLTNGDQGNTFAFDDAIDVRAYVRQQTVIRYQHKRNEMFMHMIHDSNLDLQNQDSER